MRLKQRFSDFQVRELLAPDVLLDHGPQRVYRVMKKRLTTAEAVRILSQETGVEPGQIGVAGLKDRQGVTTQHLSAPGGREVHLSTREIKIDSIGFAAQPLSGQASRGNAFELIAREVARDELAALRSSLPVVRTEGLVNYFDDQRFGNLKHGQGWIARSLMLGRHEEALQRLFLAQSEFDSPSSRAFKDALGAAWGDWRGCREIAGRFRSHHSVFEHLAKHPGDFAGAFYYVSAPLRLIHLYAWQSHVWNRAVCELLRRHLAEDERVWIPGVAGALLSWAERAPAIVRQMRTFRLPGPGLEDVQDPLQRELLAGALAAEELTPERFRIEGVSGFQLKGEDRPLVLLPRHLRVRPPEPDRENPSFQAVRVRFELPRGAYATLVVARLFGGRQAQRASQDAGRTRLPESAPPPRWRSARGANEPGQRTQRGRDPYGGRPGERPGRERGPQRDDRRPRGGSHGYGRTRR